MPPAARPLTEEVLANLVAMLKKIRMDLDGQG
jgi:hypothetical protein